jgi:prolyl-tRNA synthetase
VGSDTGMMGGSVAHEFMLLSEAGEDNIAICPSCGYMDNVEVARTEIVNDGQDAPLSELHTPGIKEIAELEKFTNLPASRMIKACVFAVEGSEKPCVVFIRGDYEVNETKLKKVLRKNVFPLVEGDECGLVMGYIGPIGLNSGNITVLFDESLKGCKGMVCGANRENYHYLGASCGRDFAPVQFFDLYKVKEGDKCLSCGGKLAIKKGIEVGNIFQLGKKYTESMNMTYLDENGERKVPIMGCYGIGIGRAMASAVEANHDDYGPIWPFAIAPWHIHICLLGGNPEMKKFADDFYLKLEGENYEVIYDDREVSAGVQFSDADLLGVPYRVIFGAKNFEKGLAEIALRDKSLRKLVPLNELETEIKALIAAEKAKL